MQRIIYIDVAGNRARVSARELGTQGEVAATALALTFDASWDGLAKRLLWRSASGAESAYTLLSPPDAAGVYSAAVPALPLSEAGAATLSVEGVETSGGEVARRARSVVLRFRVEPNALDADSEAEAVDASVAEQLASAIEGKAAANHTHAKSAISDFAHTHTKSDVTDFAHSHEQSEVAGLSSALAGKAAASHSHAQSDVSGLASALAGKAASSHTHTKSAISDFAHTHTKSDVSDFSHTHTKSEITDFAHTHEVAASGVSYDRSGTATVKAALDSLFDLADDPATTEYSVSFAAADWSGDSAPYTQTVTCAAVGSGTRAMLTVSGAATAEQFAAACEACLRFSFGTRSVTATAYGVKPTVALPIKIGVIK